MKCKMTLSNSAEGESEALERSRNVRRDQLVGHTVAKKENVLYGLIERSSRICGTKRSIVDQAEACAAPLSLAMRYCTVLCCTVEGLPAYTGPRILSPSQ